jgi:hypothetical protein
MPVVSIKGGYIMKTKIIASLALLATLGIGCE